MRTVARNGLIKYQPLYFLLFCGHTVQRFAKGHYWNLRQFRERVKSLAKRSLSTILLKLRGVEYNLPMEECY